jgi:hypothetical protein
MILYDTLSYSTYCTYGPHIVFKMYVFKILLLLYLDKQTNKQRILVHNFFHTAGPGSDDPEHDESRAA